MSKEVVEILVEGGKASAGAQMGQKFGPLGINLQKVLEVINEKTASFKGMKVPVKVTVDKDTKDFEISIGTPPVSELIKKELGIKKGSSYPDKDKVANISIEQVIKVAKMKETSILHNSLKSVVKTVAGSCNALGILVEGKIGKEISKDIDEGKYDNEIKEVKTEIPEEKKDILKQQLEDYNQEFLGAIEKLKASKAKREEKKEDEPKEDAPAAAKPEAKKK